MADQLPSRRTRGEPARRGGVTLPPTRDNIPSVTPQRDPGLTVPVDAFGVGAGEALASGASALEQSFLRTKKAKDAAELAAAQNGSAAEIAELVASFDMRTDYENFADDYDKATTGIYKKYDGALTNETNRATFKTDFEYQARLKRIQVRAQRNKRFKDQTSASAVTQLEDLANKAAANPLERDDYASKAADLAAEMVEASVWDAERGVTELKGYRNNVALADVRAAIRTDPHKALQDLLLDDTFPDLAAEQRQIWIQRAVEASEAADRKAAAADRLAEREKDKAQTRVEKATAKDGYQLWAAGNLDMDWLDANEQKLAPGVFNDLIKRVTTEAAEGVDDRDVIIALHERIRDGEDVFDAALDELNAGNLTQETFGKIMSRSDAYRNKTRPASPYKRASGYLTQALKPSEINDNPEGRLAYAEATADLNDWFDDNPNASVDDAMKQARTIADSYRIIDKTVFGLPVRPWMTFKRFDKAADQLNAIEADEEAALRAFQTGDITKEEFNSRAFDLKRWREALDRSEGQ